MPDDPQNMASPLCDAQPERDAREGHLGAHSHETRSSGCPEIRTIVRITRHGVGLLDVDNGCGGCKALLDALRYEGLIKNDDPATISFQFFQKKVPRKDRGTLIEIIDTNS